MITTTLEGNGQIRKGRTEIIIPYLNETITFSHPFSGPGTYQNVGKEVLENKTSNLSLPNGLQTAHLLHAVYCSPQEEFRTKDEPKELREKIMKNNYLWIYNRNLWSSKGVYVVPDPTAVGLSEILNEEELESKLERGTKLKSGVILCKDGTAFAPKGTYKLGEHTQESFSKDGFVIASVGELGAEKLTEVSTKFRNRPFTYGMDIERNGLSEQRLSAVGDFDGGLLLIGFYRGVSWVGCVSGVLN